MAEKYNICPTCGKPVNPHTLPLYPPFLGTDLKSVPTGGQGEGVGIKRGERGFLFSAVIGSLAGLAIGIGFVIYGFGIYAGFFHTMAIIHETAGTLLGFLAGLAVGFLRR